MNNLIKENNTIGSLTNKQPNTNYTIDENGKTWISQGEIGRLIGISQQSISKYIQNSGCELNLNKFNQLDAHGLVLVVGYYVKNIRVSENVRLKCSDLLEKFSLAGAEVFLRGMALKELKRQEQQVIPIEQEIKQLKSDNEEFKKELSEMKTFLLTHQQEKINPHEIHDQYLEWTNKGWLKCYITDIKKYNYELTDIGLEHLIQIKNKFRLKEDYEQ